MLNKNLIELLGKIVPERFQDLLAVLDLLTDELKYTQDAIDSASKSAINHGHYDEVPQLLEISKALKEYADRINTFLEENSTEEAGVNDSPDDNDDEQSQEEPTNYSAYDVDDTVPYDLFTQVTYKRPAAFSFKGRRYKATTWAKLLTLICELLCKENENIFSSFPSEKKMQGRRKPRFSTTKASLRVGVLISNSGVYVETNLSANDVRKTILAMLDKYGISSDAVRIYFRRDLTPLHTDGEIM